MFNKFRWYHKKPRIKATLLQKSKEEERIAITNVWLYYQAAVLEYLVQCWDLSENKIRELEQLSVYGMDSEYGLFLSAPNF